MSNKGILALLGLAGLAGIIAAVTKGKPVEAAPCPPNCVWGNNNIRVSET